MLLDLCGARLVTDPVLRGRLGHLTRRSTAVSPADLGRLDAVLVSHVHRDHLDVQTLRRLEGDPLFVVPTGAGEILAARGFTRVEELAEGGATILGGGRVTAVRAEHHARRGPFSPWVPAVGYLIEADVRVYFAGDTDVFGGMADLAPLDVALLPVWGWGPSLSAGHMNPRAAAEALALLRPTTAVPIHWGTFYPAALRGRRLAEPPREFARHAAELAPDVEVRVLEPGEAMKL